MLRCAFRQFLCAETGQVFHFTLLERDLCFDRGVKLGKELAMKRFGLFIGFQITVT